MAGYEFGGWYKYDDQGTEDIADLATYKFIAPTAANMTYYVAAKWTPVTYKLVYLDSDDKTEIATVTVTYNDFTQKLIGADEVTALIEKEHVVLSGWTLTKGSGTDSFGAGSVIADNFTYVKGAKIYLKANWAAIEYTPYTVTYYSAAGDETAYETIQSSAVTGRAVRPAVDPTKSRFVFVGWATQAGAQYGFNETLEANLSLYAVFRGNDYTFRFVYGFQGAETFNYTITEPYYGVNLPNAPAVASKEFIGWSTQSNWAAGADIEAGKALPLDFIPENPGTITLYAVYKYPKVDVDFSGDFANGDALFSTKTNPETGTVLNMPPSNPLQTGYSFVEWNTRADGAGVEITSGSLILTNTQVFAVFAPINYTVRFNANGGTGNTESRGFVYDAAQALPLYSALGYTAPANKAFAGWALTEDGAIRYNNGAMIDSNNNLSATGGSAVVLYAVYKYISRTVTVYDENESEKATLVTSIDTGKINISLLPVQAEKTGYKKYGYYTSLTGGSAFNLNTVITADTAIYARYVPIAYKVNFVKTLEATGTSARQSFVYDEAQALSANPFSVTDKIFKGWALTEGGAVAYTDGATVKNLTSVDADTVNLYPIFKYDSEVTVSFNSNGVGYADKNINSDTGTIDSLPVQPNRTGYDFGGWYWYIGTDLKEFDITAKVTVDTTVYAQWTAIVFTVIFSDAGTTGGTAMPQQEFNYDQLRALYVNTYTVTDKVFRGWATTEGGAIVYTPAQVVSNLRTTAGSVTLYPVFKYAERTVTLVSIGSPVGGAIVTSEETGKLTESLPLLTRNGYAFGGWFDGQTQITEDSVILANVELSAKWTAYILTVVFNHNGIEAPATQNFAYGQTQVFNNVGYADIGLVRGWTTTPGEYSVGSSVLYATGASFTNNTTVTGNATLQLYSVYHTYVVSFENGNLPNHVKASSSVTGKVEELPDIGEERPGYMFVGFTDGFAGGTAFTASTVVDGNKIVYAQWVAVTYTVKFYSDSTLIAEKVYHYGEQSEVLAPDGWYLITHDVEGAARLEKAGAYPQNFIGWSTSIGGSAQYAALQFAPNLTRDNAAVIELHAVTQASADKFTIFFNLNGGVGYVAPMTPNKYNTYDDVTNKPDGRSAGDRVLPYPNVEQISKTGYIFVGWDIDTNNLDGYGAVTVYNTPEDTSKQPNTVTLYAFWRANSGTLKFEPNALNVDPDSLMDNLTIATGINGGYDLTLNGGHDDAGRPLYDIDARPYILPANTMIRPGYRFLGWMKFAEPEGGYGNLPLDYTDETEIKLMVRNEGGVVQLFARWVQTDGKELELVAGTYETYYILGESPDILVDSANNIWEEHVYFDTIQAHLTGETGVLHYSDLIYYGGNFTTDAVGHYKVYFYYAGYSKVVTVEVAAYNNGSNASFTNLSLPQEINKYVANSANDDFMVASLSDAEFYIGTSNYYLASPTARVDKTAGILEGSAIKLSSFIPAIEIIDITDNPSNQVSVSNIMNYLDVNEPNLGRFKFKDSVAGRTIMIVFAAGSGGDRKEVSYKAKLTKGYNIYTAAELSIFNNANINADSNVYDDRDAEKNYPAYAAAAFLTQKIKDRGGYVGASYGSKTYYNSNDKLTLWRAFKVANGVVETAGKTEAEINAQLYAQERAEAVILQRDIKVTLKDMIPQVLDRNMKDEFGVARLANWQYLYTHFVEAGETFSFIGNYFSVNAFDIPWIGRTENDARMAYANQNGFVYSHSALFYIMGTTQTYTNDPAQGGTKINEYMGDDSFFGSIKNNPTAFMGTADEDKSHVRVKNIRITGNTGRIENIKGSGGLQGLEFCDVTDARIDNAYLAQFTDGILDYETYSRKPRYESVMHTHINRTTITNMFTTGICQYETGNLTITHSRIFMTGGPALLLADNDDELADYDTGPTKGKYDVGGDSNLLQYDLTTGDVWGQRNTPTLNLDDFTFQNLNTAAAGGEAYFVVNMITAMITNMKGLSALYEQTPYGPKRGFLGQYFGSPDGVKYSALDANEHSQTASLMNLKMILIGDVSAVFGSSSTGVQIKVNIISGNNSKTIVNTKETNDFYGSRGLAAMPYNIALSATYENFGEVFINPTDAAQPAFFFSNRFSDKVLAGQAAPVVGYPFPSAINNTEQLILDYASARYRVLAVNTGLYAITDTVVPYYN
ncbi:MAG: InlB B-repeat-containing protein, partial [Christensenellaceae bacterium]|jgi:uncharacterized repeat protein (TIGR02543 family)|nr:InlB B-repeat-containing protein [Christensenellaceae bacterium]